MSKEFPTYKHSEVIFPTTDRVSLVNSFQSTKQRF